MVTAILYSSDTLLSSMATWMLLEISSPCSSHFLVTLRPKTGERLTNDVPILVELSTGAIIQLPQLAHFVARMWLSSEAHNGDHGDDSGVKTSYAMRSPHTTLMTETTPDTLDDFFIQGATQCVALPGLITC